MSACAQVSLMRSAQVVIGVHGADLTNVLWMENPILGSEKDRGATPLKSRETERCDSNATNEIASGEAIASEEVASELHIFRKKPLLVEIAARRSRCERPKDYMWQELTLKPQFDGDNRFQGVPVFNLF